jgi:hypothetical protein
MNSKYYSNNNQKDSKNDLDKISRSNSVNIRRRTLSFDEANLFDSMNSFFNEDAGISSQTKRKNSESLGIGSKLLKKLTSSKSINQLEEWKNFPIV